MNKRTYTKEEKDEILDKFRKRVLTFFIMGPIITAIIISMFVVYILGRY